MPPRTSSTSSSQPDTESTERASEMPAATTIATPLMMAASMQKAIARVTRPS